MPTFRYTAISPEGKRVVKNAVGESSQEITAQLLQSRYFVIEVKEQRNSKQVRGRSLVINDKIFFTQNLSVLLSSGVSLGEALATIAEDTSSKRTSAFYLELKSELERGAALSKALSQYPNIFDPVYISLVEAGENSGQLDTVMASLAESLEKDVRMYNQVRSALLYPAFVLGALILLAVLMIFFVLPKVTKVFESLSVDLPVTTQLLVRFGNFAQTQPLVLLGGLVAIITASLLFVRSAAGRNLLTRLSTRTPFVKQIVTSLDLSRLSSTLALLLNAGVPIQQSLEIAGGTVKNPKLRQEFRSASEKLANGVRLAQAFQGSSLPKTFITLVSVGERSGKIASVFTNLDSHYTNVLDTSIKNFTGILEPVLTLVVGLLVGGVVITVMVPLYQLVGNLQPTG